MHDMYRLVASAGAKSSSSLLFRPLLVLPPHEGFSCVLSFFLFFHQHKVGQIITLDAWTGACAPEGILVRQRPLGQDLCTPQWACLGGETGAAMRG